MTPSTAFCTHGQVPPSAISVTNTAAVEYAYDILFEDSLLARWG